MSLCSIEFRVLSFLFFDKMKITDVELFPSTTIPFITPSYAYVERELE